LGALYPSLLNAFAFLACKVIGFQAGARQPKDPGTLSIPKRAKCD
jgi:hypothetical protein